MASSVETFIRSAIGKGVEAVADFNRRRMPTAPHPFLEGIHTPMTEELTIVDLAVTGTIPPALDGRYLRIGPNPIQPDPAGYHWFSGDGMVHGVAVKDGKALWYRNRWIRSRAVGAALGQPAAPGPRHGGFDTVNTNVVEIGGRTWALVEAGSYPVEFDEELGEQTYNPFDDTLQGSFTAHPHRDPLTGEHHAIAYEGTDPTTIRHVVIAPDGKVVREEPIPVEHGPSIHDCAITARFAIILDLPVTFSMKALIGGHRFPYRWNPDHRARVGLLPRAGTAADVIWCDVPTSYVFHVANAYDDDDGRVVLDVCAFETMFDGGGEGPNGRSRGLERWTIDPTTRAVSIRTIDPAPQEFPRPDERRIGQPYRYAYTMALPPEEMDQVIGATQLYKHDLATGTRETHEFGPGRHPGEFVFVPAHEAAGEDEGWLIGLVVDLPHETTDLVIIDARDFTGTPVASIRVPHRIPPGFHGNWLPRG
ncbi:8'-apo-carotenoid 13,14-cleaving dioxygenase [Sphingomonas radiodurans]|uniref:8'-apo-carotenoid 13,14-cleaving dioxygenase n=1 Tax=Sphingomonas radiodurans TaxID=2890321 RepID=UPI001E4A5420|nr:carotenoid oxygenase family protein [Sphingomonas radiodurans]WBH17004.1 carotenoid oxygenase family protein [Sphingomonas radiodurans]